MSLLNKIYINSPYFLKNIFINFYGIKWYFRRYGKEFHRNLSEIIERESWDFEKFKDYQRKKLKELINLSYHKVPYYKELFEKIKLKPEEINSEEDLIKIPLLKRDDLRNFGSSLLLAKGISKYKLNYYFTSGSTYFPIKVAFAPNMHSHWNAFYEARCRRWAGVNWKDSRSNVGGRIVISKDQKKPPFWVYNLIEKQLYFSAFHISLKNIKYYAYAFEKYKPKYQCGYTHSTYLIAQLMDEEKLSIPPMKAVLCTSENLTGEMREKMKKIFGCPAFDNYSLVEACCLASECEYHNLHISPDVGIIEIIDEDGNPVKEGEIGEIVATGFLNFAQPLIRYKTGDLSSMSFKKCSCGREMPILNGIEGRVSDLIIGKDGKRLGSASFAAVFYKIKNIREAQIIQEDKEKFKINVVPLKSFIEEDKNLLLKKLKERLGEVEIEICILEKIERTKSGKFKPVINNFGKKYEI